ncbi:hypothetical protein ACS0TY_033837 [Phlomoides rotata]
MSTFPEIHSLFAALASNLRAQDPTVRNEVDLSISNLNRTLNLNEPPRVCILDTALSLMCFTAPQVYDSVIEFTLKTIVTVLSSSIECKVLRINQDQVLRVGGLISRSDCASVLEMCAGILGKLDGLKGDLCYLLIYNVFRVAALAPCCSHAITSKSYGMKFDDSSTSALADLAGQLPKELTFKNGEIPLRLLLWHLDPMNLKQDISEILREIIKRPFLSVRMELYDRIEWRSKIICLVISPTMFIETRAFLHSWFLMTGLASVIELQTEIVGQVLDIISRPMWWGISMDVGSKLLFSHAYFPHEHHLLRTLAGPISLENFQQLLHKISGQISHVGDLSQTSSRKTAKKINVVDHKSMWAMVMNFPGWLSFASMILFSNNGLPDNFYPGSIPGSDKHCVIYGQEVTCPAGAAKFIAWILNPMSDSSQHRVVDYLVNVSDLWTLRYSSPNKYYEVLMAHKETSRLKLQGKDGITSNELDIWIISLWLKEFKDLYVKHFGTKVGYSGSNTKGLGILQEHLLRRIPLGILLLCPSHLNGAACLLLLHYAATGIIPEFSGKQSQKRGKRESCWDPETWIEQCTKAEAVAGCRTVFDITDIAESICYSLFETEEEGTNFVCQVKLKACSYLLKCIKRLLQIKLDEDGFQMQRDLLSRVLRWRSQVKDVLRNNKDLDCVCDALNV